MTWSMAARIFNYDVFVNILQLKLLINHTDVVNFLLIYFTMTHEISHCSSNQMLFKCGHRAPSCIRGMRMLI